VALGKRATLTEKYNAGLFFFDLDRSNWGCAHSRAFREVASRTAEGTNTFFTTRSHRRALKISPSFLSSTRVKTLA
jgi:hypothetical protein